jgi:hypothetical protein
MQRRHLMIPVPNPLFQRLQSLLFQVRKLNLLLSCQELRIHLQSLQMNRLFNLPSANRWRRFRLSSLARSLPHLFR